MSHMAIQSIHHHKLFVGDTDRSLAFYRDLLGFEVLQDVVRENVPAYDQIMGLDNVKVRVVMMHPPGKTEQLIGMVEFLQPAKQTREQAITFVGTQALALVVDDIDAETKRLRDAGVRLQSDPVDIVREGKVVARANYIYDPDGMAIELYELGG
jgi:catechol 2,3-dioxygenase-like lactoylglutathione lyase family enzyme